MTQNVHAQLPPQAIMLDLLCGMMKTQAIHHATRLDIASLVKDGSKTVTELASATGTQPEALYRLLATLASFGVFEEVEPSTFAQTPLSHVLRPDVPGSMYNVSLLHGEPWQWHSWEAFGYSLETGQTALEHLYHMNLWEYFGKNPEVGERFSKAMTGFSMQVNAPIAQAYDFSQFHTLVDIGGGYGSLLTTILQTTPTLQGILFDLPTVIKEAREHIASSPIAARCELVAGDVFAEVPKADAYIMKQIIKDWNDEECICILSNCRKAMNTDGRVLVAEQVLLPGKTMVTTKLIDLQLLAVASGQERYEAQYRALFEGAGLRLVRIWPTRSPYSILEGAV